MAVADDCLARQRATDLFECDLFRKVGANKGRGTWANDERQGGLTMSTREGLRWGANDGRQGVLTMSKRGR